MKKKTEGKLTQIWHILFPKKKGQEIDPIELKLDVTREVKNLEYKKKGYDAKYDNAVKKAIEQKMANRDNRASIMEANKWGALIKQVQQAIQIQNARLIRYESMRNTTIIIDGIEKANKEGKILYGNRYEQKKAFDKAMKEYGDLIGQEAYAQALFDQTLQEMSFIEQSGYDSLDLNVTEQVDQGLAAIINQAVDEIKADSQLNPDGDVSIDEIFEKVKSKTLD